MTTPRAAKSAANARITTTTTTPFTPSSSKLSASAGATTPKSSAHSRTTRSTTRTNRVLQVVITSNSTTPSPTSPLPGDELNSDNDFAETPNFNKRKTLTKTNPVSSSSRTPSQTPSTRRGKKSTAEPTAPLENDSNSDEGNDFVPDDVSDESSLSSLDLTSAEEEEEEDADDDEVQPPKKKTRTRNAKATQEYSSESEEERPRGRRATAARKRKPKEKLTREQKFTMAMNTHHPELATVWDDLDNLEEIKPEKAPQPTDLRLKLLPFQQEGVGWMCKQEKSDFRGGILADEMGMGKTIQTISLLLLERGKPTLVVAPTVALYQWKNEITTHTGGALSVLIYHGSNRGEKAEELLKYDVILTTYSIIESSFRKQEYGWKRKDGLIKEKSILHSIHFYRVVLDEAHNIKDRSCNTARATFALQCDRKWSLSGTPLQNRVGELYSQIRFLEVDPYAYYFCKKCDCKSLHWKFADRKSCDDCGHRAWEHTCWWNGEILKPIQKYGAEGDGKEAFKKLKKLLSRLMLRRTKLERADDLGLPPRLVATRKDLFNEEEMDFYESLFKQVSRKFSSYVASDTVLSNYANIFELLMRMRQAVNHPDLIVKHDRLKKAEDSESFVCGICSDECEDPIQSKCRHVFCREDARDFVESCLDGSPECPVCFASLQIDLSQPTLIPKIATGTAPAAPSSGPRSSIVNRIDMDRWRSSTKIEALVEELEKLRRGDATIKSIVFSQFIRFLQLVAWRLKRAGFECVMLDGSMSPAQRDAAIRAFSTNPHITVFLVSLKAGGVALNLTEASQVFLMDAWWNPQVMKQASDRVHRLGQHRPIRITRLIIENSIESRIIELQEKKEALFESTIGGDTAALNRLTKDDLQFLFCL